MKSLLIVLVVLSAGKGSLAADRAPLYEIVLIAPYRAPPITPTAEEKRQFVEKALSIESLGDRARTRTTDALGRISLEKDYIVTWVPLRKVRTPTIVDEAEPASPWAWESETDLVLIEWVEEYDHRGTGQHGGSVPDQSMALFVTIRSEFASGWCPQGETQFGCDDIKESTLQTLKMSYWGPAQMPHDGWPSTLLSPAPR